MNNQDQQDVVRTTRSSLRTLQKHSIDRENSVGRSKSLKHQLSQDSPVEVEVKRKNSSTKETQANLDTNVTIDDLTNPKKASENYWKILAKKRQVALQETLDENEKLRKIIEDLKEKNALYKQMLDEANSFVEVIKEEFANASRDDTGIDVNDCSTADETLDDHPEQDSENDSTAASTND